MTKDEIMADLDSLVSDYVKYLGQDYSLEMTPDFLGWVVEDMVSAGPAEFPDDFEGFNLTDPPMIPTRLSEWRQFMDTGSWQTQTG